MDTTKQSVYWGKYGIARDELCPFLLVHLAEKFPIWGCLIDYQEVVHIDAHIACFVGQKSEASVIGKILKCHAPMEGLMNFSCKQPDNSKFKQMLFLNVLSATLWHWT